MITFMRIETGYKSFSWGIRIEKKGITEELVTGKKVTVTKKDGSTTTVTLGSEVNTTKDLLIWTIQRA